LIISDAWICEQFDGIIFVRISRPPLLRPVGHDQAAPV
jgi:hypothetical protein